MRFESPWFFLLLLLLPALEWWRLRRSGARASVRFSWTGAAAQSGESLRQRLARFFPWIRLVALALFIVALARPQKGMEQIREANQGIAIEMLVDRSPSMEAPLVFQRQKLNRLEVVKRVFQAFVQGDGRSLKGRPNDLVGMIAFARYAETVCPLTLAHEALPQFLQTVHLAKGRSDEDGTAIGDAVALGAARLHTAEETLAKQAPDRADKFNIKSKVMILLTDGRQTAGKRDPKEAARMAKDWGIKIYAILVGSQEQSDGGGIFGRFLQMGRDDTDPETLKAVAELTGGKFYEARDGGSLASIYQDIDRLEKSDIQAMRFVDYKEVFTPFALFGLLLLVTEAALNCTVFRRIP